MRKLLLVILAAMPLVCSAQFKYKDVKCNPEYLTGAVSTNSDGSVYIERTINTEGKTAAQVMSIVDALVGGVSAPAKYIEVNQSDRMRIYRIEDKLVFRQNFINSNVATMAARLMISVENNQVVVRLDNIIYRIGSTATTTTNMPHDKWKSGYSVTDSEIEIITAEEMISDKEALKINKTNSAYNAEVGNPFEKAESSVPSCVLRRYPAKFRVKTIDYIDALTEVIAKRLQ